MSCEISISWRCCRCQALADGHEVLCPACGHWRCAEVLAWYEGTDRPIAATWWALVRASKGWAAGASHDRLTARAAALAALVTGKPSSIGEQGRGQPVRGPALIEGDRVTVSWDQLDGVQVLTIAAGAAGTGFSGAGSIAVAKARAIQQSRLKVVPPRGSTGGAS